MLLDLEKDVIGNQRATDLLKGSKPAIFYNL